MILVVLFLFMFKVFCFKVGDIVVLVSFISIVFKYEFKYINLILSK